MENPGQQNPRSSTSFPPDVSYPPNYPPAAPGIGYPQPYVPPFGGQPNRHQPYYPPQPLQQQQQQVVVMSNQRTVVRPPPVSMDNSIYLSCFVFWFFGGVCGGMAFILAMMGQSSAAAGDIRGANQLRNASYFLSIAGVVCGIIIIAVVASMLNSTASPVASQRYYYYNGYTTKSTLVECYDYYYDYYYYC